MHSNNPFFNDLARLAGSAAATAADMKREFEATAHAQFEQWLARMDLVTREEFDAVKAMAAKAREENAELKARLDALEKSSANSPSKKAAAKPAAKKASAKTKESK